MNLVLWIRAVIAILIVCTGAAKLSDVSAAAKPIGLLIPMRNPRVPVVIVASVEIALGMTALASFAVHLLDALIVGMLAGFLVVSSIFAFRHPGTPCRCFGGLSESSFDRRSVLRNGLLLVLGVVVLFADRRGNASAYQGEVGILRAAVIVVACLVALVSAQAARALDLLRRGEQH